MTEDTTQTTYTRDGKLIYARFYKIEAEGIIVIKANAVQTRPKTGKEIVEETERAWEEMKAREKNKKKKKGGESVREYMEWYEQMRGSRYRK